MEEYLDFRDDTGFNSPNLRKSAYFSEKMLKKRQKFQAFHGILSDDHGGGMSRENGFHGRERDFTVEHGIITERNRISQEIRTGENGILQEKTGFYGSKLDWTGEDGRERDFTGENGISREISGFTVENGILWKIM